MKQAQKMQAEMQKKQAELEDKTFSAKAGGGAVEVEMSGKYELLKLALSKDIVDPDDTEMLQDLITVAVNDCIKQIQTETQANLGGLF
jgi:DNA-binding YbaB/EbfC family protein